jgi:23S rRNA (guanosine2251-2'-O)-methyltransferase
MHMSDETWLEGIVSVEAAVRGQNREIRTIYVRRGRRNRRDHRLRSLLKKAQAAGIAVERVTADFIAEHAEGKSHGGILAQAGPRRFVSLSDLIAGGARPFIVMLDGIEDPFNFGQAVRTLYAAGADGLVVRPRNWLSATAVVARASAGATELIPMAVAETALDAAQFYREQGLTVACTAVHSSQSIYDANLNIPLFLLIGGEKRGITRSFLEQADLRLQIPYGRPFNRSLGAAASAAILGFEIMRQRGQKG